MSDTRVSDALRKIGQHCEFVPTSFDEHVLVFSPSPMRSDGITHGDIRDCMKALPLALELEQQVESLRAEQDGVRERIAQCGIDIEPRESTTDWLSQVLQVLLCSHGIVERLEAERDELLADKERLVECLGKIGLACAENDLNEAYHWFYTAVVKDFNLPAEEQAALTRKALDAARKPVC